MGVVWSLVKSIFGASQPAEYPPPASRTDSEPEDVPDIQPNAPTTTDNDTERPLATMAPSKDPEVSNFADRPVPETTPTVTTPSVDPPTEPATLETPSANGQPTKHKKMDQTGQKDATAGAGEEKISGAELKKRKQAEKAARRAKEKQGAEQAATTSSTSQGQTQATGHSKKGSSAGKDVPQSSQSKADSVSTATPSHALSATKPSKAHHKRTPSSTNLQKQRTRDRDKEDEVQAGRSLDDLKPEEKRVPLFGHLYGAPRREHYRGAEKDVHPSVLALGMQMVDWVIVGANARTVAMLMAFKQVIQAYTTPTGTSLSRHLTIHLGHQIDFIKSCRPLGIPMGNSIRWLKLEISKVDPSTPEDEAKKDLCTKIDQFIRERITIADEVISKSAASKIANGDVILTANKSSIVQETLLEAKRQGKTFRVYIIDSRPLFEGKALAKALIAAKIEVTYSFHHALAHAAREATKCFLGAHAMMSNGRLFSRCGTAMVALMAHEEAVPVIVCCESIKFTERVALDSIVQNEIASPEDLVGFDAGDAIDKLFAGMSVGAIAAGDPLPSASTGPTSKGKGPAAADKAKEPAGLGDFSADDDSDEDGLTLEPWRGDGNEELTMLNLMFDLTPAEYIDLVVCEYGNLPPSSVPVVHRMSGGQ